MIEPLRRLRWLLWGALALSPARGETWQTTTGERVEGRLSAVYGPLTVISTANGSSLVPIEMLGDAELGRVADYLATRPTGPVAWKEGTSKVGKVLRGKMQVLSGKKLVDFDPGTRAEPDFFLVYFGAYWCGPCRQFSPGFVQAYEQLQRLAPGRFEVVFVSSDNDSGEMLKYVREVNMPWPILKFSQVGRVPEIQRWAGRGIPCVVALTREGDLIFHSYRGEEYLGPGDVLEKFEKLLRSLDDKREAGKRALHRLAVVQHVRAAGTGSRPAQPYLLFLDYSRYRTLETKELVADLEIDEKGRVAEAHFEPKLPPVLEYEMVKDADSWLFLPAVKDGQAQRRKVQLPLKLQ